MSGLLRNSVYVLLCVTALLAAPGAAAKDGSGDAQVELKGVVQAAPATGLIGDWKVAGRTIHATAATVFDQSEGKIGVGAQVEVKGNAEADGSVTATRFEVAEGVGAPPPTPPGSPGAGAEFSGAIDSLPSGTLLGKWQVAGRSVGVLSTTRLEQERGGFIVGAIVEVHGTADATGFVSASEIELKSGGAAAPVPSPAAVEVHGKIDALPASGLIGTWTVTGRMVTVNAATLLDAEGNTFAVGDAVEVKGSIQADGSLLAARIEREDGNGGEEPAMKFAGKVDTLPSGTTGVIGVWQVGGKKVNVTAQTRVTTNDAPLVVGVTVEIEGWLQADSVIEAQEIETRAVAVAAKTGVAVEFFNAALGHFFVSASAVETAALDAGAFDGLWKRTGETFSVGGASMVCRFYGMPPKGPDSHFFTVDVTECEKVMQQMPAWRFEGHAFAMTAPATGGACPAGTLAVHRFFNNPSTTGAINHRLTVTAAAMNEMVASGWVHEGVVMCAPQ